MSENIQRFKTNDPQPEQKLSDITDKVMKEPLSGDSTDGWHCPYLSNQKAQLSRQ